MAITYPRTFPVLDRFAGGDLRLTRRGFRNELYGGAIQTMELVDPLWVASYTVRIRNWQERMLWKAWLDSLRGGAKRFWGHHPILHYPLAYGASVLDLTRAGGGAFDGECAIEDADANTIELSDLPAGYQASVGDMVSIVMTGGQRSLHRIVEAATADGEGEIELTVEPYVRPGWASESTAVQLVRASCLMVLKEETVSAPDDPRADISFEAVQALE